MKSKFKFLGIITIIVIITIAVIGCDNGTTPEIIHEHQWGEWIQSEAPTCVEAGAETRVCLIDPSHKETHTGIPALGHDMGNWEVIIPATTQQNGKEERICRRIGCNHVDKPRYILATSFFEAIDDIGYRIVRSEVVPPDVIFIPSYFNDKPVIAIGGSDVMGNGVFQERTNITTIHLPDSITSIGNFAFAGCTFTEIVLPEGLTTIGQNAFLLSTSITSLIIPASVTNIAHGPFAWWTNAQTIFIEGFSSQEDADIAWGNDWRSFCSAVIKYWNGSDWGE